MKKKQLLAVLLSLVLGAIIALPSSASQRPSHASVDQLKLMASASSYKQVGSEVKVKTPASRVKLLVRKLFYNYSQAYAKGTVQGLAFTRKNNYPKLFNTSSLAWISAEEELIELGYYDSIVPSLDTLIPDPSWKIGATNCSKRAAKPLRGETFLLTVSTTSGYTSTGESFTNSQDLHVTILKNKAYFYLPICGLG